MPIPIIVKGISDGLDSIPWIWTVFRYAPWILLVAALKYYFGGARNTSERLMHSKVVMVTVRLPSPSSILHNLIITRVAHLELAQQ
jgi:small-conductance mechanosensitive channel